MITFLLIFKNASVRYMSGFLLEICLGVVFPLYSTSRERSTGRQRQDIVGLLLTGFCWPGLGRGLLKSLQRVRSLQNRPMAAAALAQAVEFHEQTSLYQHHCDSSSGLSVARFGAVAMYGGNAKRHSLKQ